jgi:ribosomal protein L40E
VVGVTDIVQQDVHDGQVISPKIQPCRQRLTHAIGAGGAITTTVFCINPSSHGDEQPHVSHPYKNIFSGEVEYLIWREDEPDAKPLFVMTGFDQFTCMHCSAHNQFHGVLQDCWRCDAENPPSNYDFDP